MYRFSYEPDSMVLTFWVYNNFHKKLESYILIVLIRNWYEVVGSLAKKIRFDFLFFWEGDGIGLDTQCRRLCPLCCQYRLEFDVWVPQITEIRKSAWCRLGTCSICLIARAIPRKSLDSSVWVGPYIQWTCWSSKFGWKISTGLIVQVLSFSLSYTQTHGPIIIMYAIAWILTNSLIYWTEQSIIQPTWHGYCQTSSSISPY